MRAASRLALIALVIGIAGYAVICVAARFLYPRMLFPAPRLDAVPHLADPTSHLVDLRQADGTHTVALHYPARKAGARTVVVFHGNGETIFDNQYIARELSRRGLGVLLVEYRGYGTTFGSPPTEAMLYEDGEAAIAYLKPTAGAIALWGWSLGSSVAAEMAYRGHGARLLLLSPFTSIIAMGRRVAPMLPVSLIMTHRLDTLSKAPSIQQPTLVIHGDADEVIPFSMGEAVARAIPQATFVRVDGGHHADLLHPSRPNAHALLDRIAEHLASE